ncbi:hypothetical protein M422DRAFT_272288 [Sphaerobolus stellatus SS14]|uniref:Uncharacterized protein n=1 Tax=Sphaerobolus stellatus (strain SS14) TaxID=990650 RepID=A0A0C9UMS5_SPHS4|nr:hypothetical protein M422DRAFT_272288 [Sphaerobolus stellatus SS14]
MDLERELSSILNREDFKAKLSSIHEFMQKPMFADIQLVKYSTVNALKDTFEVFTDHAGIIRLVYKGTRDEAVFALQGVILKHDLPPLRRGFRFWNNALSYSQSVIVTARGTKAFSAACDTVAMVYTFFASQFREDTFLSFELPAMGTMRALSFSARYFSKQRCSAADVDIPPNMDRFGVLAEHLKRNDRVRFTTENIVQYRQISKREEGDEV